jgi:hypothetical protein
MPGGPPTGEPGIGPTEAAEGIPGRPPGGVPCLDCWNALILACMSCDKPPPARAVASDIAAGGLRALLSAPRGVDEGVIAVMVEESEAERREGTMRGGLFV